MTTDTRYPFSGFRIPTASLSALLFALAACNRTQPDPPPIPDTTTVVPSPPTVATLTPLPGQPPVTTPLPPQARTAGTKPPPVAATATALGTNVPVPFTPYVITIPTALPFPLPTFFPTAFPVPTLPPVGTAPAPPSTTRTSATTPPPTAQPPVASDARVIEYGTNWCGPCKQLKADLTARQVPFVYVDLEDPSAMRSPAGVRAAEMPANMRNGVPVTRVVRKDGGVEWVQGAAAARIEGLYRGT